MNINFFNTQLTASIHYTIPSAIAFITTKLLWVRLNRKSVNNDLKVLKHKCIY